MNKICEEFQKIEDEFNEKIEEFQRIYDEAKKKGNVNLDNGKNFFEEIEILKNQIKEKVSENRQLRFFDSSYGVYREIEQNVSKEGFGKLVEMEMRKDGTIIAKTETIKNNSLVENFLIEINLDDEISLIPIEDKKINRFYVGDNSIFVITNNKEDEKNTDLENLYEVNIKEDGNHKIQKVKNFQGNKLTFDEDIFAKDDIFFAITNLINSEKEEKGESGILYKKLGEDVVFLSSENGDEYFYDMGLDENTNSLSGIVYDQNEHKKIFDIKENDDGEYYLDYRDTELHNKDYIRIILNDGSLLTEKSEHDSDSVHYYIDNISKGIVNKKILTIEKNDGVVVSFKLKGGAFAVENQYNIQNKSVSEIYLVKEDGDVEIIKKIDGCKLTDIDFLKIQADGTLTGKDSIKGAFMFDGEKYVFLDAN